MPSIGWLSQSYCSNRGDTGSAIDPHCSDILLLVTEIALVPTEAFLFTLQDLFTFVIFLKIIALLKYT